MSTLMLTPAVVASSILLATSAFAADVPDSTTLNRTASVADLEQSTASNPSGALSQVTSVSQLSDVQPTDWAFQALQSLVERYGCIAGYPNRTYRGNRPLTRYEFAAGLNACMDRVNELIASATADAVKKEDLEAIKKLQEEFGAELASLRGQVDSLEARTKTLEAQQFSTTTKLKGVVIFALAGTVTGDGRTASPIGNRSRTRTDIPDNTTFSDRVRLNLDTSFTGQDRLRVRLQAANFTNLGTVTGTAPARISYDSNSGNAVQIHRLEYRFPVGSKTRIYVEANQGEYNDIFGDNADTLSPLGSSDEGSNFRFARFNPIFRLGPAANQGGSLSGAAGFGFEHTLLVGTDGRAKLQLDGAYLANNAASPLDGRGNGGLFGGGYSTIGHLIYRPTKRLDLAATYVRAYSDNGNGITGGTGSAWANNPFNGLPTTSNNYGVEAQWRAVPNKFTLAAWGGYTQAYSRVTSGTGINRVLAGNEATIINWNVTAAFPDVIRKGDLAAISIGQPPYVDSSDFAARRRSFNGSNDASTWNLEASYRLTVNDNISLTPGLLYVINPENNSTNDNILVGIIRTVFRF